MSITNIKFSPTKDYIPKICEGFRQDIYGIVYLEGGLELCKQINIHFLYTEPRLIRLVL